MVTAAIDPSTLPVQSQNGLLRTVSNAEINRATEQVKQEAEDKNNKPVIQGISGHVMKCWEAARSAKSAINERLLKAQRARMGQYDPSKLGAIKQQGGSEEYARVTDNKCRVAEAWLRDVYLGQTEKPWSVSPTPNPDFPSDLIDQVRQQVSTELAQAFASDIPVAPEEVTQRMGALEDAVKERLMDEARKRADRMQAKMADQLEEGGFNQEWAKFLADLTTYPAAHFKGPVLRMRKSMKWVNEGGKWTPKMEEGVAQEFERIDAFRAYPAPGAEDPQDGFFIEHISYSRDDIYSLIGIDGFDESAIRAVLDEYGRGGLQNWLGLSAVTEANTINDTATNQSPDIDIDCLEFHGQIRGKDLVEWGLDAKDVEDPDRDYEANVWLIGRWVIKAQLNYDPLGRRGVYKTSYEKIPGSYWGLGLADILDDVQGVVNAAVRSLVNNMGIASGPQVAVNVDRLPQGEDITDLHPWKIWQVQDSKYGDTSPALQFFQPNTNVQDLLAVIEKFYQFGDDWSLIPRYMSGNDRVGGAGRTASGLSMLLNAANKGLKGVVSNIDTDVLSLMLTKQFDYNMLYDPDQTIKGDSSIVARGAVALMQMESLQLRRNEFLQATANPIDQQIIGVEGRANVLREVAKGLEMDVNQIIPTKEELQQKEAMQQQQMAMQQGGGQPAPNGEKLMNGAAVTDNFSPSSMKPNP